jgi:TRAP-type mannitol/chloroaromatic compound transport system permease small subunit
MIGAAYTFKENGHVRVDLILSRFSPRTRAVMDISYWIIFVLPVTVLLVIYSIPYVADSWSIYERSAYSAWRPYIFPLKTIIPIAFILLGLQVVADIIRKFRVVMGRKEQE